MRKKEIISSKFKRHTVYKNSKGERVVGTTTVTGQLGWNKHILVKWANNLGLAGVISSKYRDDKAEIGTIAHGLLLEYHGGEEFDLDDYSKNQIKLAKVALNNYLAWLKGKKLKPILLEKELVSDKYNYGGTVDNYCKLDGKYTLLDYKTGSGIYLDHFIQVAGGYRKLLLENGHPVDQVIILNIPRTGQENFRQKRVTKVVTCWKIFKRLNEIYQLKKRLERK